MSGWTWFVAGMGTQTLILTLWAGLVEIWIPVRNARRENAAGGATGLQAENEEGP